jgi:esterase/lipase
MKIHVYPGMGATSDMYKGLWKEQNFTFHNWPKLNGEKTIEAVAKKIINEHDISEGDILIGSSLGGIISCEVANQLKLKHLFLVGSAKDQSEINSFLKLLHPIVDYTPVSFIKALTGKIPMDLSIMFNQSEPEFIKVMSKAIFVWEGLKSDTKVTRIHGTKDLVIPKPKDNDFDINGGHLIAMTHAEDCIRAIQQSTKKHREQED